MSTQRITHMKKITYTINTNIKADTKTAQVNQLISALTALFTDKTFTLADTSACIEHGLKTKQDATRIFAYYQNDLINMGFLIKHVEREESAKKNVSRVAQIRELAAAIANDIAISDESRAHANAIIELLK